LIKLEKDKLKERRKLFSNLLLLSSVIGLFVFLFWMRSDGGKCAMNPLSYIEEKNPDWSITLANKNMIVYMNESELMNNEWAIQFKPTELSEWIT